MLYKGKQLMQKISHICLFVIENSTLEKQDTFVEKLVTQIIKNLQVQISNIHVRYEDNVSIVLYKILKYRINTTQICSVSQLVKIKWAPLLFHRSLIQTPLCLLECHLKTSVFRYGPVVPLSSVSYVRSLTVLFCNLGSPARCQWWLTPKFPAAKYIIVG